MNAPAYELPDQEFFLATCEILVESRVQSYNIAGAMLMKWHELAAQQKQIII